ncbi:MAG: hypothetical protein ACM4D3_24675 [Candidatus Sericytochromatia bacterium]
MSKATDRRRRIEHRQRRVEQLRRQSMSLRGIADELGVTQVTVLRDLRAIEQRLGQPIDVDWVRGDDGKFYPPKVTYQDYEPEPGFGEDAEPEGPYAGLTALSLLDEATGYLELSRDALVKAGVREEEASEHLGRVRTAVTAWARANRALPTPRQVARRAAREEVAAP